MDLREERISNILNFWFEGIDDQTTFDKDSQPFKKWFSKDDQFDQEVKEKFEGDLIRARKRKYDNWLELPKGYLALVLVFDQFPRNMYRDMPEVFDNDLRALEITLTSIKRNIDDKLMLIERLFLYLPLMHSEDLKIQKMCLERIGDLVEEAKTDAPLNQGYYEYSLDYSHKHYDIIKRFGRFPHRNKILGRSSSAEEESFLKEPGSTL